MLKTIISEHEGIKLKKYMADDGGYGSRRATEEKVRCVPTVILANVDGHIQPIERIEGRMSEGLYRDKIGEFYGT